MLLKIFYPYNSGFGKKNSQFDHRPITGLCFRVSLSLLIDKQADALLPFHLLTRFFVLKLLLISLFVFSSSDLTVLPSFHCDLWRPFWFVWSRYELIFEKCDRIVFVSFPVVLDSLEPPPKSQPALGCAWIGRLNCAAYAGWGHSTLDQSAWKD